MASKKSVDRFLSNQKSIQFYPKARKAFQDVLSRIPADDFEKVTKNLILMVLHEGAIAQVMHFNVKGKCKVLQLTFPKKAPITVLRYIIAHELGHVLQGRNWKEIDGMDLEYGAEAFAKEIGFARTKSIDTWLKKYRASLA